MDLNFPVFSTGVRIFRACNDVGPLFVGPGSTRLLECLFLVFVWTQVDPQIEALKIRTPVANMGKLRSIGQIPVVLADDPNYEYYLQKLTTGSELIEHNFSDSWSGTSDRGSRIIKGHTILYYDRVQSKPFLLSLYLLLNLL